MQRDGEAADSASQLVAALPALPRRAKCAPQRTTTHWHAAAEKHWHGRAAESRAGGARIGSAGQAYTRGGSALPGDS